MFLLLHYFSSFFSSYLFFFFLFCFCKLQGKLFLHFFMYKFEGIYFSFFFFFLDFFIFIFSFFFFCKCQGKLFFNFFSSFIRLIIGCHIWSLGSEQSKATQSDFFYQNKFNSAHFSFELFLCFSMCLYICALHVRYLKLGLFSISSRSQECVQTIDQDYMVQVRFSLLSL